MSIYRVNQESTSQEQGHQSSNRPASPQRPIRRSVPGALNSEAPRLSRPQSKEVSSESSELETLPVPRGKALDVGNQIVDPAAAIAKELLTDWRYDC